VLSELLVPIGSTGLLMAGSTEPAAFDEQDRLLGELLAGTIATALASVDRLTALEDRERELRQQNARLEEFAGVVSHDLRNPLNIASGHLDLLNESVENEHVDAIARAHTRMRDLIEDLLELARSERRVREPADLDLEAVARSSWETVDTPNATLVLDTEQTVRANESQLRQLLENLFRNAVEHGSTDGGAEPRRDDPAVTVRVGRLADGFFVEDTGPGIPETDRGRVFEPGFSTSPEGTGFGLSIVKQIVDTHGWRIDVTAGTDGGARFEVHTENAD